ncbi:hypothetical protein SEA_BUMBLE_67 [Arthrobacter phage Bumble]
MTAPERCLHEAGHEGDCVPVAAGPSREDLYEAAVRAVLDLCDREELEPGDVGPIPSDRIRAAIREALEPRAGEISRATRDRVGLRAVLSLCDRLDEVPGVGFGSTLTGAIRAAVVRAWEEEA